ncbi:DUF3152 domain-containing protein [Micromonospora peucetia]|uniref:DUF3152 domain-containing protein n=1 Tax=Micromonospora peucetia TaxID=47871 RepID=A0ABZ1E6N9_9ACTN|nr:DUF3152 domain-containing protein [Micromonospora peucetia]WSA29850.1 DUF3152 domain-containing protein [Micromonospora peucetia]
MSAARRPAPARHVPAPAEGRRRVSARSPVPAAGPDLTRPRHRRPERRRLLVKLLALVLTLAVAVVVIANRRGADVEAETLAAQELAPAPVLAPPAASPLPSSPASTAPSATTLPQAVLRLPGPVPSAGRGSFGYDDRAGPVLGDAGTLRRYRVAVESGADEDAGEFGAAVELALTGPGSWVDGGLRLQQVRAASRHDFTVYLATARTAGQMCAAGGVNIRVGGQPYTSCRAPGKVIINLDRWRLSVPHFVSAKVPLSVYRTYVVNHEVGHQLGHRHERCPGKGRVAPVMMQQTLFLDGCVANPWPYRDGRRYAGPRL